MFNHMAKVLALGAHKEVKSIKEKLKISQVDMKVAGFQKIEIFLTNSSVDIKVDGISLQEFDYVWITSSWGNRSIAYAVYIFLKYKGIKCNRVEMESSKLTDMLLFALNGLRIPDTYFSHRKTIENNLCSIESVLKYPFVMKTTRGSLGRGVYLLNSKKEFTAIASQIKEGSNYICQKFIPNNFDYRIIVGNNNILSACKRIRQSDFFRNNSYLGAKEEFVDIDELSEELIEMSIKSAALLNLPWAGVDIVTNTENGKNYILEINRRPGLTENSAETAAVYKYIMGVKS
jgi:glutathione synthase/RimK-type ligase-like ATP-grasp enzyme